VSVVSESTPLSDLYIVLPKVAERSRSVEAPTIEAQSKGTELACTERSRSVEATDSKGTELACTERWLPSEVEVCRSVEAPPIEATPKIFFINYNVFYK